MMKQLIFSPPKQMQLWFGLLGGLMLLLSACGTAATPEAEQLANEPVDTAPAIVAAVNPTAAPLINVNLEAIPRVDQSKHSVPLEEIYFDTFRSINRVVPLTDISPDMVRDLLDAIPPIYNPKFEAAAQAESWVVDTDIVLGYADGGEAFAYPVKVLNWHEMVAHDVNGRSILATY